MKLRHLGYFVAAADDLNLSRASRKLRISQPAVSRIIRKRQAISSDLFECSACGEEFERESYEVYPLRVEDIADWGSEE